MDKYIVALSYFNFKKSDLVGFIELFGSAEEIFRATEYDLLSRYKLTQKAVDKILACRESNLERAEEEVSKMSDFSVSVLTYGSESYPLNLLDCYDAPLVLYAVGDISLFTGNYKSFSITGTKSYSDCGAMSLARLVEDMAEYMDNAVIVSGIADGIEKMVHRLAVKNKIRSVVVMPKSLDALQKESYISIVNDVLRCGGAVVSEYPFGTPFHLGCYKESNRIVASLSHATVLVEAPLDSNTLNTIKFADSYCREVFAFPGRVVDVSYGGCNTVIRSGKAEMILSFNDIVNSMELVRNVAPKEEPIPVIMCKDEKMIFDILRDGVPHSDEEIMIKTGLSSQVFSSLISMMELNDIVVSLRGRMYIMKL